MHKLQSLIDNNIKWAEGITKEDPDFFKRLSEAQSPEYLWIGCSDSRVPANEIVGLLPGEIFVHRNIANLVVHTDFNCMSVIEFSVKVLKVKHIIVCGHYGCGGVKASIDNTSHGLIDNWLYSIRNIYHRNKHRMDALQSEEERHNVLCELNVMQQVKNVAHSHVVQDAWAKGQDLTVHSWVYTLTNGQLTDLQFCASAQDRIDAELERAVSRVEQLVRSKA